MRIATWLIAFCPLVLFAARPANAQDARELPRKKVAALVTEYRHNSHADMLVSRILQSSTLDGKGEYPRLELVSVYTDQVPTNDTSRALAKKHGFRLAPTVEDALTLGTGMLAVDGVLMICEHGQYPESDLGQFLFPKRRVFGEMAQVFEKSKRAVPVFQDKHLSHSWDEAKWMYDTSKTLGFPMMAGSSIPLTARIPSTDVRKGAKLKEIVVLSYHRLDSYGFHGLEVVQALAERRAGGETGVKSVRCLHGPAVWEALKTKQVDPELYDAAVARLKEPRLPAGRTMQQEVADPVLFLIDYEDGLRASVFTLNYVVFEWTAAWRTADDDKVESFLCWAPEERPFIHFYHQLQGVEKMIHTGKPTWPVERTLLTTGMLDSLLISHKRMGERIETPQLKIKYQSDWEWKPPPPAPKGRPLTEQ